MTDTMVKGASGPLRRVVLELGPAGTRRAAAYSRLPAFGAHNVPVYTSARVTDAEMETVGGVVLAVSAHRLPDACLWFLCAVYTRSRSYLSHP